MEGHRKESDDATTQQSRVHENPSKGPTMIEVALWALAGVVAFFLAFRLLLMWLFPTRPPT